MDDSPGRLLSSLSGGDGKLAPQVSGGIFMRLFDWKSRLQAEKIFSLKPLLQGCLHPSKGKRSSSKLPMAKLLLNADENCGGASSSDKASEIFGSDSTTTQPDQPMEYPAGKRNPGVVARLMGLESLPAKEFARDRVSLRSDEMDQIQEDVKRDAMKHFTSTPTPFRESKIEDDCMPGSSNGQNTDEGGKSAVKVTAFKNFTEKPLGIKNADVCANMSNEDSVHSSISSDHSSFQNISELLYSLNGVSSYFPILPSSVNDKQIVSEVKEPNWINCPYLKDFEAKYDRRFLQNRFISAPHAGYKEVQSPTLGNSGFQFERNAIGDLGCTESPVETDDCHSLVSESDFFRSKEALEEEIRKYNKASEWESTKFAPLPSGVHLRNKREDESFKNKSASKFSHKKLELDTLVEGRPLNLLKSRSTCEKKAGGFDSGSFAGFSSAGAAIVKRDLNRKAVPASPRKVCTNNVNKGAATDTKPPSTYMPPKLSHPAPLSKSPYLRMEPGKKTGPRTFDSMQPKSSESLSNASDVETSCKQQPSLSSISLSSVEKLESACAQGLGSKRSSRIFLKKSRLSKNIDMHLNRSGKPSLMSEHFTRPSTPIFSFDKDTVKVPEKVVNRVKKERKICLKQPKLDKGSNMGRIVPREAILPEDRIYHDSVPSRPGYQGDLLQNNVRLPMLHSNSDAKQTDRELYSNPISDCQSLKFPGKMDWMEGEQTTENPHKLPERMNWMEGERNTESPASSGRYDFSRGSISRQNFLSPNLSRTIDQTPQLEVSQAAFHKCIYGAGKEGLPCMCDKHMVNCNAPSEISKSFYPEALNSHETEDTDCWHDAHDSILQWDGLGITLNDDLGSPTTKAQQHRTSLEQIDSFETLSESTYTEDSEHPSPVSVIDLPFRKGRFSRLQQDFQQKMHDSEMKMLHSSSTTSDSELQQHMNSKEICDMYCATGNEHLTKSVSTSGIGSVPTLLSSIIENEKMDSQFRLDLYVKRLLDASGFESENKKWLEMIMSTLKEHKMKCESLETYQRLLFDCVNEAFKLSLSEVVLGQRYIKQPFVSFVSVGELIFNEVCNQLSGWQNSSLEASDIDVGIEITVADSDWKTFGQELSSIAIKIECMTLNCIIEELLLDLVTL